MLASTKRNGVGSRGTPKAPPPATAQQVREATPPAPPSEVVERAQRRQFSAEYKQRILREADQALASGEEGGLGALLRREGLYSSHLLTWRKQRERGELAGLTPQKRGRKAKPRNPLAAENERLQRRIARLEGDLEKARIVIAVQKNSREPRRSSVVGLGLLARNSSSRSVMVPKRSGRPLFGASSPQKNMARGWLRTCDW